MRRMLRPLVVGALALTSLAIASADTAPVPVFASAPAAPVAPEVLRNGGTACTVYEAGDVPVSGRVHRTVAVVPAIPHDGDPTTTTPAVTATVAAGDRTPSATLTGLTPGVAYDVTVTSVGGGGSATAVANPTTWLPEAGDGLVLWLDVSHPDTFTVDGAQLATLTDRSPAGNDVTAVTQPWPATGGHRGRAVTWGFPGVATNDSAAGSITVPHHTSLEHQGDYTALMALHQTTANYPMYAQFLFKSDNPSGGCYPTQYQLAKFGGTSELYGYHGRDGSGCSSFSSTGRDGITATGDQVIGRRVRYDSGSNLSQSEFLRDGAWDASSSIAGRTPNASANMVMVTPHMSETLLFTTALSDATVAAIRSYLTAKTPLPTPTVSAVTPRADGFDVAFIPGHGGDVLAAGRYQVSVDGGITWSERDEGYADSPLRVSGLAPGTTATVSVRAVSSAGTGAASTPVTVTVPLPPPPPPPLLPLISEPAPTTTTTEPTPTPTPTPTSTTLTPTLLADLPTAVLLPATVTTVRPGDTLTLSGTDFVPGEVVQAVVASDIQVLTTGEADDDGVASMVATVPGDLTPGRHTLALYAPVSGRGVRQPVTVTQAGEQPGTTTTTSPQATAAPAPTDELPATGQTPATMPVVLALLALLTTGVAALLTASRRRSVTPPPRS